MYALKAGVKQDPHRRWRLPDRIFFGHGACHTLAGVFLKYPPLAGFYAERIIPADGFGGNHVYVTDGMIAFDHHGYTLRLRLLRYHTNGWARRNGEGWTCRLERVGFDLLSTPEQTEFADDRPQQGRFAGVAPVHGGQRLERLVLRRLGFVRCHSVHALRVPSQPCGYGRDGRAGQASANP